MGRFGWTASLPRRLDGHLTVCFSKQRETEAPGMRHPNRTTLEATEVRKFGRGRTRPRLNRSGAAQQWLRGP